MIIREKWEYIRRYSHAEDDKILNLMGDKGWELVTFIDDQDVDRVGMFIFKRVKAGISTATDISGRG